MANLDIGLMPPYARVKGAFTGKMTVATGKRGMLVVPDGTDTSHDAVKISTAKGENRVLGVIASEGDPNNSGLFAAGDYVSVQTDGDAEVLFPAATVLTKGDPIIASGDDGMAEVWATGSKPSLPYTLIGYAAHDITIGAAPGLASVTLAIQQQLALS